ncbi:type II toxin-antitoxin system VapC family toxin [Sphingomonas oligophenolica]|uniref:Ribonuclease VapC n=1 Tax=Sphingomonas oligophenolica TaxID=301154 RepID=A0A502CKM8_9SPHN|nr:type II toxin-antitoxin system VapC family toxin [Sphingomonas oligophenolica]TPG12326.1 type II toxin-antitoxin system VapC family toxin [Sphingomonas oligophenolica]
MYLLDTNACLDFTLARSDRLRARVRAQNGVGMAISSITLAELRFSAGRLQSDPADERRLDVFVSILVVHPFDDDAAEAYGKLGAQIAVRRNSFDRLIAAHALSLGLTLVTNNERDFADIPGLRVENWTL